MYVFNHFIYIYIQLFKDCIRSHYPEKSSAPEIKGAARPQMYHSNGLKIFETLDDWGETGNPKGELDWVAKCGKQ